MFVTADKHYHFKIFYQSNDIYQI